MSNRTEVADKLAGTVANDLGGRPTIDFLFGGSVVERITNTAANASITATKFWSNPFPFPVQAVFRLNCDAAVAFHAANFATHAITIDNGADGSPVAAADFITNTVNYAADIDAAPATTNTANCVIAAGANVFYAVTQNSSGVALPVRMLKMYIRKI